MPTNAAKRIVGGRAPQLNFQVTEEHIATAIPEDSGHCMIADALRAAMPHARQVSVDLATIRYTDERNGRRYIYLMPIPAQVALLDFDNEIRPETFRVKCHAAQIIEPREKLIDASLPETSEQAPEVSLGAASASNSAAGLPPDYQELENARPSLSVLPETEEPSGAESDSASNSAVAPEAEKTARHPYRRAYLMANPAGGGTVPIKVNGTVPPLGALARGSGTGKVGPNYRTGKKRGFGLRVMGH